MNLKKNINTLFLLFLMAIVGVGVYFIFKPYIMPIFLAFILSQFFQGWFKKINKKIGNKPSIASVIVCFLILMIIIIPLIIVAGLVVSEATSIYKAIEANDWQKL